MSGDYDAYLQSREWIQFRNSVLDLRPRCESCNLSRSWARYIYGKDLNVHHQTYENLGHESEADVRVLCLACYAVVHGLPAPELTIRVKLWLQAQQLAKRFSKPKE